MYVRAERLRKRERDNGKDRQRNTARPVSGVVVTSNGYVCLEAGATAGLIK